MGKAENMKMIYMVYSFLWNIYSILAPNVDLFMNAGTNNNYYIYYSWFLSRSFLAHDLTLVTSIPDNKNGHLILMMIQSKHRTMLFYSNLDLVYCVASIAIYLNIPSKASRHLCSVNDNQTKRVITLDKTQFTFKIHIRIF